MGVIISCFDHGVSGAMPLFSCYALPVLLLEPQGQKIQIRNQKTPLGRWHSSRLEGIFLGPAMGK